MNHLGLLTILRRAVLTQAVPIAWAIIVKPIFAQSRLVEVLRLLAGQMKIPVR